MPRLQETIIVARPLHDCFRYIGDFSTIEQWDPGVYRAQKLTPGPIATGTDFEVIISSAGRRQKMHYTLVDYTPPHRLVLTGEGDGFRALDTIEFRALDDHTTEIHYIADLTFDGLIAAITPLMKPWLNRVGENAVQGMKKALEPIEEIPSPSTKDRLKRLAVLPAAWDFTERGYLKMERKGLSEFMDTKIAAITGPTSGLGLAAACELARLGAHLVLVGRTPHRLQDAVDTITDFSGCSTNSIDVIEADLSQMDQVQDAAAKIQRKTDRLDVLINNAGALFDERAETIEGHERSLAINLLCPYMLTEALLGADHFARHSRVINVSSGGMYTQPLVLTDMQYRRGVYDGAKAYARAKRGLLALTEHWSANYDPLKITFNSMHPGWADTPGVERSLPRFYSTLKGTLRDPRMGADTVVWMASALALKQTTGQFFFDRKPRPTEIFPGTAVTSKQRHQLVEWLAHATGQ